MRLTHTTVKAVFLSGHFLVVNHILASRHILGNNRDNLKKAGWSLGWVSAVDSEGRTMLIVDAHHGDGRRFIVRSDEKLSAFVELERQVLTVTFYLESIRGDDQ